MRLIWQRSLYPFVTDFRVQAVSSCFGRLEAIITGTVLNEIVKHANGGKMPVYPTLRLTGYYRDGMLENSPLHVLINSETKLKILSDYIDVGYSILSIGDLFIHFFVCIVFFYGIKAISKKSFGGTKLETNT